MSHVFSEDPGKVTRQHPTKKQPQREKSARNAKAAEVRQNNAPLLVVSLLVVVAASSAAAFWFYRPAAPTVPERSPTPPTATRADDLERLRGSGASTLGATADSTTLQAVPDGFWDLRPELVTLIEQHLDIVREDPTNDAAHATLGLVYEANNLWPAARVSYGKAAALNPEQPMWLHHSAIAAVAAGDTAGAMALLRKAAERFPDFAPIQHRLGDLLLAGGDLDGATVAFDRTIAAEPDRCEGFVGLGEVKLRRGQPAEAVTALERAVELNPQYGPARVLLGSAYRALGRRDEAELLSQAVTNVRKRYLDDAWSAYLPKYRQSTQARVHRAEALLREGQTHQALQILEPLLTRNPDNVSVLGATSTAYLHLNRANEALRLLRHAEELDNRSSPVSVHLVRCYLQLDRTEDALREAKRGIEIAPERWLAHFTLGTVYLQMKEPQAAYDALLKALSYEPNSTHLFVRLGDACAALERQREAEVYYRKAEKLEGESADRQE